MTPYPPNDPSFEDHVITDVKHDRGRWAISFDVATCFGGITDEDMAAAGLEAIHVGDTVRFYPGGLGHLIRGVFINGRRIFYRTEQEQRDSNAAERVIEDQRRQAELDHSRAERDAVRAALPGVFRRRLDRFENTNPHWRRDFEPYELSCCIDAVKIAAAFTTGEGVKRFAVMPGVEQRTAIPDLYDGHSGNSLGMAVRLAYHFVTDPEWVVLEHGALCPLVGCVEYGDDRSSLSAPEGTTS